MEDRKYDVIIIGAGVIGCAIANELAKYRLKICVVEKTEDVCSGTSKANSAIIHAGFDAVPGTMKAKMNIKGAGMMEELAEKLDFDFVRNGSLVVCLDEKNKDELNRLYERGIANGVTGLRIIEKEELRDIEPAISDEATAALYAPTAGIVCPFGMTVAFAENAAANGTEFLFETEIKNIQKTEDEFELLHKDGTINCKYIVNAAGVYADEIHNMVCEEKLHITPRTGEYCLFDKTVGEMVRHTIFQLPGKMGKGILVTPTVHGNLLMGPTASDTQNKDDVSTSAEGLEKVLRTGALSIKEVPKSKVITSFAGLRAHEDGGDFILREDPSAPGFFDAAGIESPGLSGAPAIGEYIAQLVAKKAEAEKKPDYTDTRKGIIRPSRLSPQERKKLIEKEPAYGNIVCRCEGISEGEIRDAIRRNPGARSLDGIKRRVRQGMGRCQSGFCLPKAIRILAQELGIKEEEVCRNSDGSRQLFGKLNEVTDEQ